MDDIRGKVALVTGASQGLGKVIAVELGRAGCEVIINYAHNTANAEKAAAEVKKAGGRVKIMQCDVGDEKSVNAMFAAAGRVDILVNNARVDPWLRSPELSEGEWFDRVIRVNLKGAFLCSTAFFGPAKARNWGRIVNLASVRSFRPAEMNTIAYSVSKLGMHSLTRAFADNGARFGVTANTVCPGVVITENIDKRLSPEKKAQEFAAVPIGRGSSCGEIADAVLFVLRNASVTGETVNINGGMYYAP